MDRTLKAAAAQGLYPQLLGSAFVALPPGVRALHAGYGLHRYRGEVEVIRGRGALARLCSWVARLPPAWRGEIEVDIEAGEEGEVWTRRFGTHAMRSRLWAHAGLLSERLGPMRFGFSLDVEDGAVIWRVERASALGIPLRSTWFSGVHAREFEAEGRYRFDVSAAMPILGLLVAYRGWLHVR